MTAGSGGQVVLGRDGRVHVERADPPGVPGPGERLVAPRHVGICGSDLHVLNGRHPFVRPPVVTGHEVLARDPGRGERVVVDPLVTCGRCERCREGRANLCTDARVRGFKAPGLARDAAVVAATACHPVPAGVPDRAAALVEPLAVGRHAVRRAPAGGRALVVGGGPIGLAVLWSLRDRAAEVTVVEPVAAKRAHAVRLGADAAYAPGAAGAPDPAGGRGDHDVAFDCVATDATLHAAAGALRPGGTLVVVGVPGGDRSLPLARLQRWEIDVRGTGLYDGTDLDAVLARLAADPAAAAAVVPLVTAEFPVHDAAAAFAAAADPEQVKVLLTWP